MARVKRSVHAKKKRREVLKAAKGYTGSRRIRYRIAKEQVRHSGVYAYRDRRDRKGQFRRLWIARINAAVARLKKDAARERDRSFLVEGAQGISEAIDREPPGIVALLVVDPLDPLAVRGSQRGVEVSHVSPDVLRKLTSTVTPQGIVGIAPYVDVVLSAVPRTDPSCVSVLHEVRDPGNAGTVLRSADAAGASAVVFTSSSVDVYNPKTIRASAGSLFHLPVVREVPTPEVIESLRGSGFRTFAMDADGSENLYGLDLGGRVAF